MDSSDRLGGGGRRQLVLWAFLRSLDFSPTKAQLPTLSPSVNGVRYNDGNDFLNMRFRLVCGSPAAGGIIGNNQYLGAYFFFGQASSLSPKWLLTAARIFKVGLALKRRT